MFNAAAMRRLEGHGLPCAFPDVFSSEPAPDESPTIKRYREPRVLAPVHRTPAATQHGTPRRRKCSVNNTPTASPRTYKTRGPQGVERALEDLMQNLKVATVSLRPERGMRREPPSAWSDSDRERESRQAKTPAPRRSESVRRFAASLRSKSSLSLRSKRPCTPAIGTVASANSSTWSFAASRPASRPTTPAVPAVPAMPALPMLPTPTSAGPRSKSLKLPGFMQRLKRSRGPIPDMLMGAGHIPPALSIGGRGTTSPLLSTHSPPTSKHEGSSRPASPMPIPVNNGHGASLSRSLPKAKATWRAKSRAGVGAAVPAGQLGQLAQTKTKTKTSTPPAATATSPIANKASGSFPRPSLTSLTSLTSLAGSDDRDATFMTRSAEREVTPTKHEVITSQTEFSVPITPTQRTSSLSASASLRRRSLALLHSPKVSKSPTSPTSPASPSFPSFGFNGQHFPSFNLTSPLRRRSKHPHLSIDTQPGDMLHAPVASPHASPMMPCNRPLSKAEAILGVRLDSISLDGGSSPLNSGSDSSDDEVLSFSTPRRGRRAPAVSVPISISPAPSHPASPSKWLTSPAPPKQPTTPDLSFESLSELSETTQFGHPTTPPNSAHPELTSRSARAAVIAVANDPLKPRRLLHHLGARRKSRTREQRDRLLREKEWAPPVPPLPTEFEPSHLSPDLDLGVPIAPPHTLYAPGLNDVISRNFRPARAPHTLPPPRRRPGSTQIAAPAPVPIAPEARLPPHGPRDDEYCAEREILPLFHSNASVHTFGTGASHRSRPSDASSFFEFEFTRMDVDADTDE
ncbi:hypothetical protein CC85DRAFT_331141 [Cutaneotrichosporon oleaginosum]|uniref:Uncharacterized protein n=1 Tax=Cutaneotrichosporon oleaginosum TaxID=879819 RepID=A0A0J0XD21_9TREE|nr:uncharacterized protein CC85DRAFT_331141 [Cutaneotrichosporon oleaginosum]KLT38971.1 hypothetical protein CC85DRAFT_331141 [Cutaneotrichosporon oleaginosum]TXT14675.1 hypothetical protein COLE_00868 [Cutaneotrichosporon oleaginosum]